MIRRVNGQDGAGRHSDDLFRNAPQQHAREPRPSVCADHNQIDVVLSRVADDLPHGISLTDLQSCGLGNTGRAEIGGELLPGPLHLVLKPLCRHFRGWHQHFDDPEEVMNFIAWCYSGEARVREVWRGSLLQKAILEVHENGGFLV